MTIDLTLSAPDPHALALHTLAIDFAVAYERRLPSQRVVVLDVVSEPIAVAVQVLDMLALIEERAEIMARR